MFNRSLGRGRDALRVLLISLAVVGLGASSAAATTPPTDPVVPPPTDTSVTPGAPTEGVVEAGDEIVQSWALGPAGSNDPNQPSTRDQLTYDATPGATIEDAVVLYNYSNVPLDFHVYATDAYNDDQGGFALLESDKVPTDAGSWVHLAASDVTLQPLKQATIPLTVIVPPDATAGDHAGAVLAAHVEPSTNSSGQLVNLEQRTGPRVYIRVAGTLTPELAVTGVDTSYDQAVSPLSGTAHVKFTVTNRGNVRLGGVPVITLSGPGGLAEKKVQLPAINELLPGQHVDIDTDAIAGFEDGIPDVPALFALFTSVELTPTGTGDLPALDPITAGDTSFPPPLVTLMVFLVVLLGLLAWRAYRRHSRGERTEPDADAPDAALGGEPEHSEPDLQPQLQS